MFKKTIISEFFTTVSFSQAIQSLYLMTFWIYKLRTGKDNKLLEKELCPHSVSPKGREVAQKIISFYNWRSAIFHALKIIWVNSEDEVIVNAYNCVSVSNAVIQSWSKIIYSDIEEETLSFDFEILKTNISEKTKVIIIQHTFWKQARDYDKIIKLAKQKNILVIEDCAHSLGSPLLQRRGVRGEVWDFLIFSTGRDKVISSVTGWFLVINNPPLAPLWRVEELNSLNLELEMPSILLTLKNLNYNIVWYKAYKLYDFLKLWKIIIFLSRKLNFITEILTPNEKACNFDNFYLKLPNSLAYLARKELKKIEEYTKIRKNNYEYYLENSPIIPFLKGDENNFFRVPILLKSEEEKNELYKLARKNNILLWNTWSWTNLAPLWTNFEKAKYKIWSCPVAEDISKRILTLPNHKLITKKDLEKVVKVLNEFKK